MENSYISIHSDRPKSFNPRPLLAASLIVLVGIFSLNIFFKYTSQNASSSRAADICPTSCSGLTFYPYYSNGTYGTPVSGSSSEATAPTMTLPANSRIWFKGRLNNTCATSYKPTNNFQVKSLKNPVFQPLCFIYGDCGSDNQNGTSTEFPIAELFTNVAYHEDSTTINNDCRNTPAYSSCKSASAKMTTADVYTLQLNQSIQQYAFGPCYIKIQPSNYIPTPPSPTPTPMTYQFIPSSALSCDGYGFGVVSNPPGAIIKTAAGYDPAGSTWLALGRDYANTRVQGFDSTGKMLYDSGVVHYDKPTFCTSTTPVPPTPTPIAATPIPTQPLTYSSLDVTATCDNNPINAPFTFANANYTTPKSFSPVPTNNGSLTCNDYYDPISQTTKQPLQRIITGLPTTQYGPGMVAFCQYSGCVAVPTATPTSAPISSSLILNRSFESRSNGVPLYWNFWNGDNASTWAADGSTRSSGTYSVKITTTQDSSVFQVIDNPGFSGTTIRLNAYYKTSGSAKARIRLNLKNADGSFNFWYPPTISSTVSSSGWTKISTNLVTLPTGLSGVQVDLNATGGSGTVWYDNISFTNY